MNEHGYVRACCARPRIVTVEISIFEATIRTLYRDVRSTHNCLIVFTRPTNVIFDCLNSTLVLLHYFTLKVIITKQRMLGFLLDII